jgi:hypothetical protein
VSLGRSLVGGLLTVVSAALSPGCRESTKAAAPPPAVEVEPVAEKDIPIYGQWVGTTVGYVTANIRARVSVVQVYKALGGGWETQPSAEQAAAP